MYLHIKPCAGELKRVGLISETGGGKCLNKAQGPEVTLNPAPPLMTAKVE